MSSLFRKKFKTYAYDAAPFFFYIDVIEPDLSEIKVDFLEKALLSIKGNPIMPIPMRVDRVFNGENSVFIRPNKPIYTEISDNSFASINPLPFLYYGLEKLIYYTEVRVNELFGSTLTNERVKDWWKDTEPLLGTFYQLEKDFSNFLKFYLDIMLRAKIEKNDLYKAAIDYCERISDICNSRINENAIYIKSGDEIIKKDMYKMKTYREYKWFKKIIKEELHPEFFDVKISRIPENIKESFISELSSKSVKSMNLKYIPFLIYDDILDCMSSNVSVLKENVDLKIIDPTFLIDNNVIIIENRDNLTENFKKYSWHRRFKDMELESIIFTVKNRIKREIIENKEKYL